ncbi:hypothetical protein [Lysinibacillus sp. NPDC059133]|uniref:hypothetical protein n=1 Tax=Lysinibacillus sp. NPDC059133 TaxID=3346737 RepID=UPI0036818476
MRPESALCLGLQMFFVRKRSANAAAAKGFVCTKAKRQQKGFICAKRQQKGFICAKRQQKGFICAKRQRQQHDVGHSVVATGRGALRLSSSISEDVWTSLKEVKTRFVLKNLL